MNSSYHQKLQKLLKNTYAPYSHFPVAALVISNDGRTHQGVNVENAAYPSGLCAERSAIFGAISYGWKKDQFQEIHIITKKNYPIPPCLACRQVMTEFFAPESLVHMYSYDGQKVKTLKLQELAPQPILKEDIV